MNYQDVQNVILKYVPEVACDFADRFSRFPCSPVAQTISAYLRMRAGIYKTVDTEVFTAINAAADMIDKRAEY